EEHQVHLAAAGLVEGGLAVLGLLDVVALVLEDLAERAADARLVVCDEDRRHERQGAVKRDGSRSANLPPSRQSVPGSRALHFLPLCLSGCPEAERADEGPTPSSAFAPAKPQRVRRRAEAGTRKARPEGACISHRGSLPCASSLVSSAGSFRIAQ